MASFSHYSISMRYSGSRAGRNAVNIVGGALRALARGSVSDTGRMGGSDNVGQAEER